MNYYFSKKIENISFEEVIASVKSSLQSEGFGVLTEIDVKSTLKKKLNVDFRNYIILGACNPPFAYKALQSEINIGTMLPCNVVVYELDNGIIQVSAIDPAASMMAVENKSLISIASEVQAKLKSAIEKL